MSSRGSYSGSCGSRMFSTTVDRLDVPFALPSSFVARFAEKVPPFGFNGLGELVYQRTYARVRTDGSGMKEQWFQTVERVVNGTFNMQRRWMFARQLPWNDVTAQRDAQVGAGRG